VCVHIYIYIYKVLPEFGKLVSYGLLTALVGSCAGKALLEIKIGLKKILCFQRLLTDTVPTNRSKSPHLIVSSAALLFRPASQPLCRTSRAPVRGAMVRACGRKYSGSGVIAGRNNIFDKRIMCVLNQYQLQTTIQSSDNSHFNIGEVHVGSPCLLHIATGPAPS